MSQKDFDNEALIPSNSSNNRYYKWKRTPVIAVGCIVVVAFLLCLSLLIVFATKDSTIQAPIGLPKCYEEHYENIEIFSKNIFTENRNRLLSVVPGSFQQNGFLFFVGNKVLATGDGDTELLFRQNSNFLYLTGVELPDCFFAIDENLRTTFFVGALDSVWVGQNRDFEEWKTLLEVDRVLPTTNVSDFLAQKTGQTMHTLAQYMDEVLELWKGEIDTDLLGNATIKSRAGSVRNECVLMSLNVSLHSENKR